jgi:hypothetical protein
MWTKVKGPLVFAQEGSGGRKIIQESLDVGWASLITYVIIHLKIRTKQPTTAG